MSKRAEEMALRAYPKHSVLIQPARRGGYYADGHLRDGFIKGYEQAEKDLALTPEDIKAIVTIADSMLTHTAWDAIDWPDEQKYYEEVLRRFNEQNNQ